jgi:UDP-N-acetylmuramoylalanine--D-glutamate ligase
MLSIDFFRNKRVTVLGLARSGEAAADLLSTLDAHVLVSDQKDEEQLREVVDRLTSEHPQIKFHLGGHPNEIIRGADLIVKSPGVPMEIPVLESARGMGILVIGEVELAYRVCRAPIIAITGTKGKSTTSTLLGQILSEFRSGKTIVAGNIGRPITRYVLSLTEEDLLVLEVSSFQLEATVDFAPKISVILNIKQDHFDRHGSIEAYAAAKYKIFANQTGDNYTIINADDPLTMACASRTRAKVILFSTRQKLDEGVFVENGQMVAKLNGSWTVVCRCDELGIPGQHNLSNAMAAAAVALVYGVEPKLIREELKSFSGLEHALEFVDVVRGVKFINDSKATNVVSLKAALKSLSENAILIMGGRDKGNDYDPIKPLVQEKVSHLILIGESADRIQEAIGGCTNVHRAATMADAVNMGYSLAKPGDAVILSPACASFDMFRDYAERGLIFKEAVKKIAEADR